MNEHFLQFFPDIKKIISTKHFKRDIKRCDCIIEKITDKANLNHTQYHKYEDNIDSNHIFRAIEDSHHIVYAIDKEHRLIFLRAFKNFEDYKKFLVCKRCITDMINNL